MHYENIWNVNTRLINVFQRLDDHLQQYINDVRSRGGLPLSTPVHLRIVGQLALILSALSIPIASTTDLDTIGAQDYTVSKILQDLLLDIGLALETDQHLIWMPPETTYRQFYPGKTVHVTVADPLYVIASKCKFRRLKDRILLRQYFTAYPESRVVVEKMGIATAWVDV